MFFNACDPDNDGYIDFPKIKKIVFLGLTKEEISECKDDKSKMKLINSKAKEMITLIKPPKKNDIRS